MRCGFISALLFVALAQGVPAQSPPANEPTPVITGESRTTLDTVAQTVAKVDGKWVLADTAVVTGTIRVDTQSKWVQVRPSRVIKTVINGTPVSVVSDERVDAVEIETKAGRLFGLVGAKPGLYRIEVICSDPSHPAIFTQEYLRIGVDPDPEPEPDPTPPAPPVSDAPFDADGFAVLIVREASEAGNLPPRQRAIFSSAVIHNYCNQRTHPLGGTDSFYRIWDDDHSDEQLVNVPEPLRKAYQASRELFDGNTPWIGIADGKGGGFAGPLPETIDETLALLKKYGGE